MDYNTLTSEEVEKIADEVLLNSRKAGRSFKPYVSLPWDRKLEPLERKFEKIGRNDPCICGSGKKWKNCHMKDHQDKVNELERRNG